MRRKVLSGLGLDHCRIAGSGSAPIPAQLIEWYRSLGLELLEGYGMTENFSYSHMSQPGRVRVGYVGDANEGVTCKISEEGEVLVKSPGNMLGYYKAPELTAEVLDDDGLLHTGDQGEIDEEGRLKITGRVKELFKTSKGKYVAPAPIENELLLHPRRGAGLRYRRRLSTALGHGHAVGAGARQSGKRGREGAHRGIPEGVPRGAELQAQPARAAESLGRGE